MRVWGRVYDELGNASWVEVSTDANGSNDYVMLTALVQVLKLPLGMSPFYADHGIPGKNSVLAQVAPDYQVAVTQQQYSSFFASLIITRIANTPATLKQPLVPTYRVNVLFHNGTRLVAQVAV